MKTPKTKAANDTSKGTAAKRAEALEALAEVDATAAQDIARSWIVDVDLEPEGASWKGGKMVSKTKMRPAAARVLASDPSDASLDALVVAHRLFAGGPTAWAARDVLVGWTRPGIAARLAAEMDKTRAEVELSYLMSTLVKRRETGDEALLGRLARNPTAEGVMFYGSDIGFQLDTLRALVAAGTGGAPSVVDVICDVLSTEAFAVYESRFEGIFEEEPERGPAIAKALLASPRFPRASLSAEVLSAVEKMARS